MRQKEGGCGNGTQLIAACKRPGPDHAYTISCYTSQHRFDICARVHLTGPAAPAPMGPRGAPPATVPAPAPATAATAGAIAAAAGAPTTVLHANAPAFSPKPRA